MYLLLDRRHLQQMYRAQHIGDVDLLDFDRQVMTHVIEGRADLIAFVDGEHAKILKHRTGKNGLTTLTDVLAIIADLCGRAA